MSRSRVLEGVGCGQRPVDRTIFSRVYRLGRDGAARARVLELINCVRSQCALIQRILDPEQALGERRALLQLSRGLYTSLLVLHVRFMVRLDGFQHCLDGVVDVGLQRRAGLAPRFRPH